MSLRRDVDVVHLTSYWHPLIDVPNLSGRLGPVANKKFVSFLDKHRQN